MRLTLRTLLAFLDNQLDPEDAASIAEKIESSEFAAKQVSRIRDVTRRLRLGAPKLRGRGMGLDPNTVAEYLDNTLSNERVPDFEKLCLESDMHLAEVAACHQILARVLTDPVEVDPTMRERMYELGREPAERLERDSREPADHSEHHETETAEAEADASDAGSATEAEAAAARPLRRRPEVPEYLRDGGSSWRSRVIAVSVAVLLIVGFVTVVLMAIRPLGPLGPLASDSGNRSASSDDANAPVDADSSPARTNAAEPAQATQPDTASVAGGSASSNGPAPSELGGASAASGGTAPSDSSATGGPADSGPGAPHSPASSTPPTGDEPAALITPPSTTATTADAMPDESLDEPPTPDEATAADAPLENPSDAADADNDSAQPADAGPPQEVGTFDAAQEILVRYDASADTWMLVPPESPLLSSDRLVGLPTLPSSFTLSSGVRVSLLDGARVGLLKPNGQDQPPGVQLFHGRIVIEPIPGQTPASLRLVAGEREGIVALEDPASKVGVEVRTQSTLGTDPRQSRPRRTIDLYVAAGRAVWTDAISETPERFTGPAHRRLQGRAPTPPRPEAASEELLPDWADGTPPLSPLDRRAAADLMKGLSLDKPVTVGLEELATHRRAEIRSLAARCLASLDEFETLLAALDDPAFRPEPVWMNHVETLVAAIQRGPEVAERVHEALVRQRPADADLIFRMLWGYTPEQIAAGEGKRLVDRLDDQRLAVRCLAFWNLYRLTGMRLYYRPHDKQNARQQAIQRWRQRLEEGLIEPAAPG